MTCSSVGRAFGRCPKGRRFESCHVNKYIINHLKIKIFKKFNLQEFIQELELDYIEFTNGTLEEKISRLPLTEERQIKGLIWNLLTSEKNRKRISYKYYSQILDILFKRLK